MHRIRGYACDGVHSVSAAARLRVFAWRAVREAAEAAFSAITEVLGNRSSGLVSSSTTWTRFRGRLGRYKERGDEGRSRARATLIVAAILGHSSHIPTILGLMRHA